jgi:hypothetical protein
MSRGNFTQFMRKARQKAQQPITSNPAPDHTRIHTFRSKTGIIDSAAFALL